MKKIYRHGMIFLLILISLVLIGCGNVNAEVDESTSEVATMSADEIAAYKERRANFDKLNDILKDARNSIITEFLEKPEDVYELIEKLYENEDDYVVLWEEAKNLSPKDYEEVANLFSTYQIHDGLSIILYHEIGEKPYASYEFGTYKIKDKNEVEIIWVQNAELFSETENSVEYKVVNQEDDAFLILKDQNGYWLVEIASTFKEDCYTRKMYDDYYEFLQNEKEELLVNFYKNPVITQELLQRLRENEAGYNRLLSSAKYLPKEEYDKIMLLVELNQWRDGIQTVAYDKKYYQKYFWYVDGEFTVSSETSMEVLWTQNIEDATEDDTYNLVYAVKNKKEDAYLLLLRGEEYQLFRITALQKKS